MAEVGALDEGAGEVGAEGTAAAVAAAALARRPERRRSVQSVGGMIALPKTGGLGVSFGCGEEGRGQGGGGHPGWCSSILWEVGPRQVGVWPSAAVGQGGDRGVGATGPRFVLAIPWHRPGSLQ